MVKQFFSGQLEGWNCYIFTGNILKYVCIGTFALTGPLKYAKVCPVIFEVSKLQCVDEAGDLLCVRLLFDPL